MHRNFLLPMCALVAPPRPYMTSFGPGWDMLLVEKEGSSLDDDASSDILRLLLFDANIISAAASSEELMIARLLLLLQRGVVLDEDPIISSLSEVKVKTSR